MKKKVKTYPIILIEIIGIILIYGISMSPTVNKINRCWFYEKTGILCPSCGGTRCVQKLLNGDIVKAFEYHPVFTITIIYLLILNIIYLINRNKNKKILTWLYPKYTYVYIFIAILIIYTIFRNL